SRRPGAPEGGAGHVISGGAGARGAGARGAGRCHGVQAERGEGDDRVTTVREDFGQGPDGTGEGQPGRPETETPRPQAPRRWRPTLAPLSGLVRRHWLFSLALAAAVVPRLVVMLGYRPAMLFRLDTFDYLWGAVHLSPNVINPSGYSLFLWLLLPFHSLVLIAALQHLLGLGVATMVYAVLRHYRLPAWGATLAAAPVLFDPEQIMIEHLIMADLLAMVLMVGSFAVLLFRDSPSLSRSATAGLMMGVATIIRPTVLPLVLLIPVYLLIRRVGWRRAGAALAAGALPVLGYMSWFAAVHGSFNMTNSNGLFLWSRTMSFADCSVIKPPPDLQALCPNAQPGPLARADPALRRLPKRYLWNHRIWAWQGTTSGFVPDTAAFTQANNERALRFAILAVKAQPVAYGRTIAAEFLTPFAHTDGTLRFPVVPPSSTALAPYNLRYAIGTIKAYTGSDQGVSRYLGYHFGVRVVHVPAVLMNVYQHLIYLPGPVFGLIVLTGLVGIIIPSRRSWPAILLWASAVIIMVLPTAEHEYTYRYVLPAVPLVCMAAALAFRKQDRKAAPGPALAGAAPAESGAVPAGPAGPPAPAGPAEPSAAAGPAEPPAATVPAGSPAPAGAAGSPAPNGPAVPAAPAGPAEPPAPDGPAVPAAPADPSAQDGPVSEGGPPSA
ncbi:MAG TPA: hypothetical protein VEH31_32680, partial [Streptosporangiaceae bacterium]|nr:hypothetical protein [Streptosporangiaceae bacterium]